uniref:Uncharacterized protein n=1 Tax=Anguilla anguilla TaxID=7936 RepID=A0A0E9SNL1_ANGAN
MAQSAFNYEFIFLNASNNLKECSIESTLPPLSLALKRPIKRSVTSKQHHTLIHSCSRSTGQQKQRELFLSVCVWQQQCINN